MRCATLLRTKLISKPLHNRHVKSRMLGRNIWHTLVQDQDHKGAWDQLKRSATRLPYFFEPRPKETEAEEHTQWEELALAVPVLSEVIDSKSVRAAR